MGYHVPMEAPFWFFGFLLMLGGFSILRVDSQLGLCALTGGVLLFFCSYYLSSHYYHRYVRSYPKRYPDARWHPFRFFVAACLSILTTLLVGLPFHTWVAIPQAILFLILLAVYHHLIGRMMPNKTQPVKTTQTTVKTNVLYNGLVITVKYQAPCLRCKQLIRVGETAFWKKGVGIWHENC